MFILKSKKNTIKFSRTYAYYEFKTENLKSFTDDIKIKTENLKSFGDDLKSKTDNIMDASFDTTLSNMLKAVKMTEQKIKMEKLDNVEISASIMLGPVSMSISKKILLE
jgi:hypothetical protein